MSDDSLRIEHRLLFWRIHNHLDVLINKIIIASDLFEPFTEIECPCMCRTQHCAVGSWKYLCVVAFSYQISGISCNGRAKYEACYLRRFLHLTAFTNLTRVIQRLLAFFSTDFKASSLQFDNY